MHTKYPRAYTATRHNGDTHTQTHAGAPVHHTTPHYTQYRSRPHHAKTHATHTHTHGVHRKKAWVTVGGIN